MTRQHPYDPDCLACTDPAQLPEWLAAERERADALDAQRRDLWPAIEEARKRYRATSVDDWRAFGAAQKEHRRLCGEANALSQLAMSIRAHADRVEAAHPSASAGGPAQDTLFDAGGAA
ncbi:hypothetical protein ACFYY8_31305 [Streptosporangium sp. NPDC001559]|uniref:hypothetical protein n=1 Tax=Streptosporangium sp. NPDC001559 TaxID=3366187 RepID=UPI0036ED96D2